MRIDRETVEKVASLAYLKLSADELVHYQQQLDQVLVYMEQLELAEDCLPADWRPDLAGFIGPERPDRAIVSMVVEKVTSNGKT